MSDKSHTYRAVVEWTGNQGTGTSGYKDYSRAHEITVPGAARPPIPGSSDPAFRGDPTRWNPEDLLVASVTAYRDEAVGTMAEDARGLGRFTEIVLHPVVTIAAGSDSQKAAALHEKAHDMCFIANSINFPVRCVPDIRIET
jgi:organic hydroperoxide reductase OsmC/OhrA